MCVFFSFLRCYFSWIQFETQYLSANNVDRLTVFIPSIQHNFVSVWLVFLKCMSLYDFKDNPNNQFTVALWHISIPMTSYFLYFFFIFLLYYFYHLLSFLYSSGCIYVLYRARTLHTKSWSFFFLFEALFLTVYVKFSTDLVFAIVINSTQFARFQSTLSSRRFTFYVLICVIFFFHTKVNGLSFKYILMN